MHQLRALTWKSYRVRAGSPFSTALDLAGPTVVIILYLGLKLIMGTTSEPTLEPNSENTNIFRGQRATDAVDIGRELNRHMCNKILYFSRAKNSFAKAQINELCGIELVIMSSRDALMRELQKSLNARQAYTKENTDLNKKNTTSTSCIKLDNYNGTIYQAGIVQSGERTFEIHMTDIAGSSAINQPYAQGSTYNEFRSPQSDLNSGIHLIELCIASIIVPQGKTNTYDTNSSSPSPQLYLKSYPVLTGPYLVSCITMIMILVAHLCNGIATVLRVSEANELGLHQYIRLSGVPVAYYWLGSTLVTFVHMLVQSLIIAILMALPSSNYLFDPFSDSGITIRWLLLLTYSMANNMLAMFVGSLFDRSSHALLVKCLLASGYTMSAMTIMLQWTPYGYTDFFPINHLALFNPASNFDMLHLVMTAGVAQTNEPFNWSHLSFAIDGGGFTKLSLGLLWALLLAQIFFWFLLTVVIDQFNYNTSHTALGFPIALANELFCCNKLGPGGGGRPVEDVKTKSSVFKTLPSRTDPNRICCSLRHFNVSGPTVMIANTRGNPLKLTRDQLKALQVHNNQARNDPVISPAHRFLVNRNQRSTSSSATKGVHHEEQPILLDEAIQQNIVWSKTNINLANLNLDFRFNQISFILGQTSLKDLLFGSLLGTRPIDSGHIILDGAVYTDTTISLARPQIGHLSEKDIFITEMTIFENLQLFGSLRDPSYKNYDSESLFVLGLLHLSSRRDNMPSALTNRSARKLALGVAAVGHTKLLLLVEPTLSLRWKPRCQVLNLLKKYKSIRSVVVDTSDVDEAAAFGDRIVLLRNGKVDLDDSPVRLEKILGCGYWLVFEPTTGDGRTVNSEAIKELEKLTNNLFKQDKFDLDATRRSVSQEVTERKFSKSPSPSVHDGKITTSDKVRQINKTIVILKVHLSRSSTQALCTILQMFSQNKELHGFRLAELTFESIEDVLVLRMSKGIFPDLPPDLLLSLQHRTQAHKKTQEPPPVSVRQFSDSFRASNGTAPAASRPIFGASLFAIARDRIQTRHEMFINMVALFSALLFVMLTLFALLSSFSASKDHLTASQAQLTNQDGSSVYADVVQHSAIEQLYKYRFGFYIMSDQTGSNETQLLAGKYLNGWRGNKAWIGVVDKDMNQTDAKFVASLIHKSKDLAASFIFYDPQTSDTTVVVESHLPHAVLGSIKNFVSHVWSVQSTPASSLRSSQSSSRRSVPPLDMPNMVAHDTVQLRRDGEGNDADNEKKLNDAPYATSRHIFQQSWHQMIRGLFNRRFIYGLGFTLAESIVTGLLIVAPMRHRSETSAPKVRSTYWFSMAIFDLIISILLIIGYIAMFAIIEGVSSKTFLPMFIVFLLYKAAILPVPYLLSLAVESRFHGVLFITILYFMSMWNFAIHLRTFIEWTLINDSYLYTISSWLIHSFPLVSLLDALTVINHVDSMNRLCAQVPAFAATSNIVQLDGVQKSTIIDALFDKVRECLANGKTGISTNVMHQQALGILWRIYLITLFGAIAWTFLLTCERFFGIVARRFNSARTSHDPLKTVVRFPDSTRNRFKWDLERDRLISEYIRCLNEINYVKTMETNCLLLRIWLKPMSDQSSFDKRLADILEPLYNLGHTKNDLQVELRTTLQIFIRIGDESKGCKVDRIQLIEAYTKYVAQHDESVAKFAIVNWTQETLYKILLHGHYNAKPEVARN